MRLLPALSVLAVAACLAAPVRAQSAPVDIGIGASATRENETTLVATAAWLPEWRRTARGVLRWELGAVYVRGRDNTRFDLSEDAIYELAFHLCLGHYRHVTCTRAQIQHHRSVATSTAHGTRVGVHVSGTNLDAHG